MKLIRKTNIESVETKICLEDGRKYGKGNKKHDLPRVNERLLKRYSYTTDRNIYDVFLSTVKQVCEDKYVGAVMLYAMGESVADIKARQSIAESRLRNWFCRAVDLYYANI